MPKALKLGLLTLLFLFLFPVACTGQQPVTTTQVPGPPSPEELAEQGFFSPEIPRVTCEELKQMMDNEEDFTLVDVRFKYFYDEQHLPGAIFIQSDTTPLITQQWIDNQLGKLPKDENIIFYCD